MSSRCPQKFALLLAAACLLPTTSHADDAVRAAEEFDKLDVNQDGRLSGTEVSERVRPFDGDRDGRVTRDEYLAATARPTKEVAEKQFQERDINQDGVLSGTEQRGVEKADANTDGEVSKQEFLAASSGTGPSRETLLAKAKELFSELDVTKDYRLSGTELNTVADYDLDSDGRMYLHEFFEGYERAQGAGWTTVEFTEGNLKVKLPATPERLPAADPIKLRSALEINQPEIRFEVRISEVGSDVEAKAEQFFTAVKDRLKTASQMEIIDEDDAPYGDHSGRVLFLRGTQGDFHVIRIVLIAKKIYELEAIYTKKPGELEKFYGQRFLESLKIEGQSGLPAPSVPAPPVLPGAPSPPAPVGDLAVPPAPIIDPKPATPPAPSAPPSLTGGPLSPRRGLPSFGRVSPSQKEGSADQVTSNETPKGTPPNGKYVLQKIGGGMLLGLGTLEVRDGKYRCGDEGDFAPFTLDAQGNIRWSAGLNFLPDGWTHEFSKYAGLDSSGRPMLKIHYHSKNGTKDIIDGIIE